MEQTQKKCQQCGTKTLHVRDRRRILETNPEGTALLAWHGCLTLLSLGLWFPIAYVLVRRQSARWKADRFGWHCQVCGRKN